MLSNEAIEILKKVKIEQEREANYYGNSYYKQEHDFVFLKPNGEPYHEGALNKSFQRSLEKNGFRKMRLYDLRHTCCSLMINARTKEGNPLFSSREIMEYMGHGSIDTTMNIYAHVEEKIQNEIPNKIVALINGKKNERDTAC